MADNLIVSGAGIQCDGEYILLNELKTGTSRIWMLGESFRVYYNNGWKLANGDNTQIYYKLVATYTEGDEIIYGANGVGIIDPWETENAAWVALEETYGTVPTIVKHVVDDTMSETYVETDDDGTVTEVKKITNLTTGYVRYEKTVVKQVDTPELTTHDRYLAPSLILGRVYQFRFVNDFISLGYGEIDEETGEPDPTKGIFRVEKVMSYLDMSVSGIDLFLNIYKPAGLSRELYEADLEKLSSTTVYKLVSVTNPQVVYYMPLMFIDGTPDSTMNLYNKLMLTIDLGVQFDIELISEIKTIIENVLQAKWGLTGAVEAAIYDKVWLPEAYYAKLLVDRNEVKKTIYRTQGNVLANSLFYVEDVVLYRKYQEALSKLAAYEELLQTHVGG